MKNTIEPGFTVVAILDACRYDYYTRLRAAELRESHGTTTATSIPFMFPYRYRNTVYVTANPHIPSMLKGYNMGQHFDWVDKVWEYGWSDELDTVHPSAVFDSAVRWLMEGKNVVAHFMQPHYPYIGHKIVEPLKEIEKVREGYMDNLKLVLEYALKLASGKTVITADHGELLGEHGLVFHPEGYDYKELREVPYEVIG